MRTIYKYVLKIIGQQELIIPNTYRILTAQKQGNQLVLWLMVMSDSARTPIQVFIVGTGCEVPLFPLDPNYYIASIQDEGFVWHIFARPGNL